MTAMVKEIAFQTTRINEMDVHILPTDKFKTTTFVLMLQQPLAEETVTKTALLSMVMKRATASFPDSKKLRAHLDFLYGAIFDVDVVKRGERQILQVYLEVPNEKFLSEKESLLAETVQFLGEVLTRPYLENGAFAEKVVRTEKDSLRKRIESIVDDKMKYANQRITEEMCKGEPFALLVHGRVEDLPSIDGKELYRYYQQLLAEQPIDLFIVGDVEVSRLEELIKQYIPLTRNAAKRLPAKMTDKQVTEIREVVDRLEVNQAKLNIGCRTHMTYGDEEYPALLVTNGVFGGFPHSKLFLNVREKASLAYYAVSRLESHKGILMIMSGIEVSNFEKAVSIIKEQLELVRTGAITPEELSQTKATLNNQFRELLDSAKMMVDFAYNGILSGNLRTLSELLAQMQQVTVEQIQQVAKQIEIDTIYLLRDKKGES